MYYIREEHWMNVDEYGEEKNKIHALRWEVNKIEKEDLIKTLFLVFFPHQKGGAFFGLV